MGYTTGKGWFMQFEGRRRTSHTPNLTPLIDVVFLLLVFFMLTSHFVREDTVAVDLPSAASGAPDEQHRQVELTVARDGSILLHRQVVDASALEGVLRTELADREDKVVRIRGDRNAALGVAVQVLDAARNAGAEAVDILTLPAQ